MSTVERFRYTVVTQRADGRRYLVSRHHRRGNAERRLIRLPLQPGQSVEVLDRGKIVQFSRCPGPDELPEIPF